MSMRRLTSLLAPIATLTLAAAPLAAQSEPNASANILTPNGGLMVWTLVIFLILLFVLGKYAFGPITEQVRKREQALTDALNEAKKDREEAGKLLAEQRRQLEAARDEGQKLIAEARGAADRSRQDLVNQAHQQQQDILHRTREEIRAERDKAIAELRREAVDLAILGASKVIEKNLDDRTNRELVEKFLASVAAPDAR
jgi:F-type H+-transporting ATPase subunit b